MHPWAWPAVAIRPGPAGPGHVVSGPPRRAELRERPGPPQLPPLRVLLDDLAGAAAPVRPRPAASRRTPSRRRPARRASWGRLRALHITTGIAPSLPAPRRPSRSRTESPSTPGIMKSSSTMSGSSAATIAIASSPLVATLTRCPAELSPTWHSRTMSGSSSTTSTCTGGPPRRFQ